MISLNPIIDCASDFDLLNYLFSTIWISAILAFGLSLECLIYQVFARSYRVLTNVTFFILSYLTPCASHTALTINQIFFGSSFTNLLNIGNFTVLAMLNHGGGGGGTVEDGGDGNEVGGGVGEGSIRRIIFLIKWIILCGETFMSSSSSPRGGEIKGLFSGPLFPSFL